MQKNSLIITIVVVAVLVVIGIIAGIALTAKGGNENNQGSSGIQVIDNGSQQTGSAGSGEETSSGTSGTEQNITISIVARTPQTYTAEISNFAFSPSEIRIKAGDKVVWTNKDSARHTVTSDSGSELGSSLLGQGESYSHTFSTPGIFNYHCAPHPYMKGKIIVE